MNTFLGIAMETWVNIDADCHMAREVSHTEAQIELGHRTGSLHLVVTEEGLARLAQFIDQVRQEMRQQRTAKSSSH
jgi:hypothetical protein